MLKKNHRNVTTQPFRGHIAAFACALAVFLAVPVHAGEKPKPIVIVDGYPVTRAGILRAEPQSAGNPALFAQTVQSYINTLLIYRDALRQSLEHLPAIEKAPPAERQHLLIEAAEQRWLASHPVTDKDIEAAYRKFLAGLPPRQWRLREIVVPDRAAASHVIDELRRGAVFSVLAAQYPQTPNAALGGELGWVDPNRLYAVIRQYVRRLKPLQVVAPVNIPQGLAIVQLLGKRATPKSPLKSVRKGLLAELRNRRIAAYAAFLRKKARIVYPGQPPSTTGKRS